MIPKQNKTKKKQKMASFFKLYVLVEWNVFFRMTVTVEVSKAHSSCMWKLWKLRFCYFKEDVRKAFSLTVSNRSFHCHLKYWEAYTVFFLSNQFYPCSSKDSKIHLHSFLENLMDVFFFPLHFPVLSSFNPPDGPLSTPSTVSFGLQSCPYTGGFKTCLKVCVKGLLRERSNCKAIVLLSVFGMILVYFEIVCTLTPTAVFIATFNWLGWTIYAARHITWTDEDLECARLKQTCTAVSQHNSALPEASRYCSSDLDLCSSGKNVTPDGESKSFAIPSLGISCLHFLSFSFLKTLFLILFPQQPCLFVSNILEVPFSSSWGNGMSLSVLTV